ncbi:hypothetical protein ASPWEDRAFT_36367 [Aspergillus wentii DTO 134E9]|uniref:FAD-binding PCMH-type domain-containing protein n=1 Tax=Aspergillus wentii DTO 134E9 TaxID=1073089 RepID=A0A1L9RUU2_ASPWE|nr:uncharacterized protein ASPWEDRAFT_36367 [Aspergillus wentii DTO 134E9]OJJ38685.1 hypothetical protein ASPWEDRAFT_36367 [Aspergillus wentii DTO 134E9]
MVTLTSLKAALRQTATGSAPKQYLSDAQYAEGFNIFSQGLEYEEFIVSQLSHLLAPLFNPRLDISVLEIGPGPKSVLGCLPISQRRKITKYIAFEPNTLFATKAKEWLCGSVDSDCPLPCLESPPIIHQVPYSLDSNNVDEKFDVILFCHSMYGMKPREKFIEKALEMLVERPGAMVVVFHRRESLHLERLLCHRTTLFPTGIVRVADEDAVLNNFAAFIAGFAPQDTEADKAILVEWRGVCRDLGRREKPHTGDLLFSSPSTMVAFTRHATSLLELTAQVPWEGDKKVKNREASLHGCACIVQPTEIRHVQQCIQWALKHEVGLTVLGGGHSGQCLWPNVVAVDMAAFDQVHLLTAGDGSVVVAESGCKTGDIIHKTMAAGLTVPLGARPSVGAGLWLQGGMGHLSRQHKLSCDAIIGAVMVTVDSSEILCVGCVPERHRPVGAVRPDNEKELLWAIKGAGTNFGIVLSVTFKAYAAPMHLVRNWVFPLSDNLEARHKLRDFDHLIARNQPRNCSADAYLFWDSGQMHLAVTMFESSTSGRIADTPLSTSVSTLLGPGDVSEAVDCVGLFEAEMYMSKMHGGHGGGKTSAFKRCLFLTDIGGVEVADILVRAVQTRPSPFCYLHLLHGGGAVSDVAADDTAFGCRDWDFACVVTGVWPRDQDGTDIAQAAEQWVYNVARDLLPLSAGVYGADLGPDPRDAVLATRAFGPNRRRLAYLKRTLDPHNVLPYACPLLPSPVKQKVIILVTGESGAGKDYCAGLWVSELSKYNKRLTARVASISDATKREYATATGADLNLLLRDRAYKEQHRLALTKFFQDQVQLRPRLPEEHFLDVIHDAVDVDVLLITGMRDKAPVVAFSHLVPDSRLIDVRVQVSRSTRRARLGVYCNDSHDGNGEKNNIKPESTALDYHPSLIFDNDTPGDEVAKGFAERFLFPMFDDDLQRLVSMVPSIPNFPSPNIEFRHVLDISQQPGGLALCTSLLHSHFIGDWGQVDVIASCEAGGFVFASALALRVDVPLTLIREAGKLPPPTFSIPKSASHISSSGSSDSKETRIEMSRNSIPKGASVVVVDDVLATGKTLYAVLQLLEEAGISPENVHVLVVAEFPVHRGREFLYRRGFGRVNIQSLLVFGGV